MERRFLPPGTIEVRADDGEAPKIAGYSAVFDQETRVGPFVEKIAPGAFQETIKQDDVRALFNHDANYVLGRNLAGTLELREDGNGLAMEAEPPGAQWANDLLVSIERGDITGQSFGFRVLEDAWETKDIDGEPVEHRTIKKLKLFDVGPVTFPAYKQTDVAVRSAEQVYEEHRAEAPDEAGAESEEEESQRQGPSDDFLRRKRKLALLKLRG